MTPDIHVRLATPADHAALQAVYAGCRATAEWLPPESRHHGDLAHDAYGETLWLAADPAGAVLGFAGVWAPESFIHHLYVRAQARRRGVGRALLAAVARATPLPLQLKCLCANTQALAFYRALGWQPVAGGEDGDGPYELLQLGAPRG